MLSRRPSEEVRHLRVGQLMEIAIIKADRPETGRGLHTDCLVRHFAQSRECVGWRYRYREDQMGGVLAPDGLQRYPHRRSGGDAVVNGDCGAVLDLRSGTACTIDLTASLDLGKLSRRFFLQIALRDIQSGRQMPVDKGLGRGAVCHCTDREFGLPRHPDLAYEDDIERRVERLGNLETDGNAAARQCQDHRLSFLQMRQLAGKATAGITAVCEFHVWPP